MIGRRRASGPTPLVRRAAQHAHSEQPGIASVHTFAAGADYDADNVSFGALVGLDVHTLDPGRGFDRHRHRDLTLVTVVLSGALRHIDDTGAQTVLAAGAAAVQVTGSGVAHIEQNASATEPVRFVQISVLDSAALASYREVSLPVVAGGVLVDRRTRGPLLVEARRTVLHVLDGEFTVARTGLLAGDQLRTLARELDVQGEGDLLVVLP